MKTIVGAKSASGRLGGNLPVRLHLNGRFSKQCMVTFASNHVEILVSTGLFKDHFRQFFFRVRQFHAGRETLGIKQALLDPFGAPGLDGKIGLCKSDLLLLRVPVLRHQIAGIASEHDVVDFTLAARAQVDHFPDVRKMVCSRVPGRFAGYLGFVHDLDEVLPLGISQQMLKVAGKPELDTATGLLGVRFEMLGQRVDQFGLHVRRPKLAR
ncbi:hypothetical protein [Caballeronia mineralivorans]